MAAPPREGSISRILPSSVTLPSVPPCPAVLAERIEQGFRRIREVDQLKLNTAVRSCRKASPMTNRLKVRLGTVVSVRANPLARAGSLCGARPRTDQGVDRVRDWVPHNHR